MSRYTYAGEFVNPAKSFFVKEVADGFAVYVEEFTPCQCGCPNCTAKIRSERPHTRGVLFDEAGDAQEYIDDIEQTFEDDYDDYLEENRYEIAQMERYEMWRNEY